ncbi:MAG TPA: hypothetical protein VIL74_05860 [Pyrinomonadaceae bacterium]|jgi:hypothetical protein
MNEDFVIEVMRTGGLFKGKHVRGVMTVKQGGAVVGEFATLERGYDYTNMKVGTYEMIHSMKRTKSRIPCLRPTNRWITTVLIHAAFNDDAKWLEGCIAPFIIGTENHYKRSAEAVQEMFRLIGGFDDQTPKRVKLVVLNNYPNEKRSAEQWIADREKLAKKKAEAARRALLPH